MSEQLQEQDCLESEQESLDSLDCMILTNELVDKLVESEEFSHGLGLSAVYAGFYTGLVSIGVDQ